MKYENISKLITQLGSTFSEQGYVACLVRSTHISLIHYLLQLFLELPRGTDAGGQRSLSS